MSILECISIAMIFGILMLLITLCLSRQHSVQISLRSFNIILLLLCGLILILAACFVPETFIRWDLINHYEVLEGMRAGGWHYAVTESTFKSLPVINIYFYLVSRLPINWPLQVIPLLVDFSIFYYIMKDSLVKNSKNRRTISIQIAVFVIIAWFSTIGIKLAITGIRTTLAVSLCTLAIYLEYVHKKRRVFSIWLYILASFIHYYALFCIAVRLACKIKNKKIVFFSVIGVTIFAEQLIRILMQMFTNQYINQALWQANRYLKWFSIANFIKHESLATISVYICFVIISVFALFVALKSKKMYITNEYSVKIIGYLEVVSMITLAMSFNYLFIERTMYILAYALLMALPIYLTKVRRTPYINLMMSVIFLWLIFFNDIYMFMVNETGVYFLAK